MRTRLIALIVLIAVLLSGCGYWVVEESAVQIGNPVAQKGALIES